MNMNRRSFIEGLGLASFATLAGCKLPLGEERPRVALQLFSIHKIFWPNPEKVLAEIAAAGYDGVEFYNFNGKTARELRTMCSNAGLQAMGTHLNGDEMLVGDALKRTLDFAAEAGFESLVTPHAKRDSADAYRKFGYTMGLAAEAAVPYGIKVGIHSTYHHFTTKYGAETAWSMIYKDASPLLQQQIDTGNTFHTGEDLVALLKKYPERHHSIHLKENVPTREGIFGERPTDGGPCVPWQDVMGYLATERTVRWHVVEAEGNPSSVTPAARCREFLKQWS